jgi:spermidine synthase
MEAAGFATIPYHAYVPSFGEWGFILAGAKKPSPHVTGDHQYLTQTIFESATVFPKDMAPLDTQINRLDDQVLVRYFTEDWSEYVN